MARYTFTRAHKLPLLAMQLAAAFPAWVTTDPGTGEQAAQFTLIGNGTQGEVRYPDATPEASVAAVIAAHDSAVPNTAEQRHTDEAAALSALLGEAAAALQTIDTERAAIATQLTLLPAGGGAWDGLTPAQRTNGMRAVLQRQDSSLVRERRLVQVVAALARRVAG
jgi:hypothetical protein